MFGLAKAERALYEARIADLKKEHQRTVEALTAWIEQLQLQVGAPTTPIAAPQTGSGEKPSDYAMYVGDEEADLIDAHAMNLINDAQLEEGLAQLGFMNKEVIGK
jgi:hypothetical protein